VLFLAEFDKVFEKPGFVGRFVIDPKQTGINPAELCAVKQTLHVFVAEIAVAYVGVGRVCECCCQHTVRVDERVKRNDLADRAVGSIDCQKDVEARDIAFGVLFREYDIARAKVIAAQIIHHVAVGVIPEFAPPDGVTVIGSIARIRGGSGYLVDIEAVSAEFVLDAVGQLHDHIVPYRRRGTGDRVGDYRGGIDLCVEISVGSAA
jgi:hypothetical protein